MGCADVWMAGRESGSWDVDGRVFEVVAPKTVESGSMFLLRHQSLRVEDIGRL